MNALPYLETCVRSWWTVHIRDSKQKAYYQRGGDMTFEHACLIVRHLHPKRLIKDARIVAHSEMVVVVPLPEEEPQP